MKNRFSLFKVKLIILLQITLWAAIYAQPVMHLPGDKPFKSLSYRCVGPTRGGRVTAVTGITSQQGTFYMGSSGGGVWKTSDYGITWNNVSDGYFASPSIGAIAVAQNHPDIVYVGTGSDGIRSNVISGKGVYKSINAGKSWEYIGLGKAGQIGAVELFPGHPDTVFVAAIGQAFQANEERGVYRSYDGGKNWSKILYLSDTVGAVDLEFAPGNPQIIYAAMWRVERKPWTIISGSTEGGIYKSTDGGNHWKKLTTGLPQGFIGKIDLAVSKADPERLYALIEAPEKEGGLYRSDDQGASFKLVSTRSEIINRPFYYCNIEANPQNASSVYMMANRFMKSTDGGATWKNMRPPHGDNHDIWINESDTLLFIESNDGGANITTNGGKTWSTQFNQPTAELYQVEPDDQFPYWLYAGQQDNSTIAVPGLPPYPSPAGPMGYWRVIGGCETGPAIPKPGNSDIVYANCKGRFGVYDKNTGQERQYYVGAANIYGHNPQDLKYRFQRVAPVYVSPHNPDVVYYGSQYLHKTTDAGQTWQTISPDLTANEPGKQVVSGTPITRDITGEEYYSTLYSIRESKLKEGLIWVGSNDGPVHVTRDGGTTWTDVTPKNLLPGGRVDCVEPSPHALGKAYIAVLRYQLGDRHPYIFRTGDYGKSWKLLTPGNNGLPEDCPTRVVREDPQEPGILYAGTEYGIYISFDDGSHWESFQQNLPVTPVTDLKIFRHDLLVSTMGRSFWIMDNVSAVNQIKNIQPEEPFLFIPNSSFRMRYRRTSSQSTPYYPAPSVILDYYLPESNKENVEISILNTESEVIRSFSSTGEQKALANNSRNFRDPGSSSRLDSTPGLHRFRWDMRHKGSRSKTDKTVFQRGPLVAPGTYEVELKVGKKIFQQKFEVLPDPNVIKSGITVMDMKEQESLTLKIRTLQNDCRTFAENFQRKKKLVEDALQKGKNKKQNIELDVELTMIEKVLFTASGPYPQPMLLDQIDYLAAMLDRADQRPGKDAYDRYKNLNKQLVALEQKFGDMK